MGFFIIWNEGPSWSYGSWIYNYLCNQCRSPLKLWVRIPLRRSVLDTTVCDQLCQWLAAGRWFFSGTPISSTNKTCRHVDMTEILLKVALNTINPNLMVSTEELVQSEFSDIMWHLTKIDGRKVFLLTKIKPEYCTIHTLPWSLGVSD